MKRGDIFYIHMTESDVVGSEQRVGRPAVIVSNGQNNEYADTVEIVYLTTQDKPDMPTHVTIRSTNRLSTALCEQVHTVSKQRIGNYAGQCTENEIQSINTALLVSLGLSLDKPAQPVEQEPCMDVLRAEVERDTYKAMYDKLLERMIQA